MVWISIDSLLASISISISMQGSSLLLLANIFEILIRNISCMSSKYTHGSYLNTLTIPINNKGTPTKRKTPKNDWNLLGGLECGKVRTSTATQ